MCVGLRCAHPTCPLTGALGRAELDKVRGQAFVPVNGPAVAAPSMPDMPSLLPEQALAALPEAPPMPFDPTGRFAQGVPFGLVEYLDLVDTMGCVVHPKKRGAIASHVLPPLLQRLGLDAEAFIACADTFFKIFTHAMGTPASPMKLACATSAGRCAAWRRRASWCARIEPGLCQFQAKLAFSPCAVGASSYQNNHAPAQIGWARRA